MDVAEFINTIHLPSVGNETDRGWVKREVAGFVKRITERPFWKKISTQKLRNGDTDEDKNELYMCV